jgi:hypothetical protein
MTKSSFVKELSPEQQEELLKILKSRFEKTWIGIQTWSGQKYSPGL